MTIDEMRNAPSFATVRVTATDYSYVGILVSVFQKHHRPGWLPDAPAWRCVVQDANGRLFIHNATQISLMGEKT